MKEKEFKECVQLIVSIHLFNSILHCIIVNLLKRDMFFEKVYDVPIGIRLLEKIPSLRKLSYDWKHRW